MFRKRRKTSLDQKKTYPDAYLPGGASVLFPQADTDFTPPLFFPIENWKGGSRSGFRHLKNAFQVLYSTMEDMGYAVNRENNTHPDFVINWSGKHLDNQHRDRTLIMEHGWIPRSSFQISDLGTNARSHVALEYRHKTLTQTEKNHTLRYVKRLRDTFLINLTNSTEKTIHQITSNPFILFPFQLATDFNLKYSNSVFKEYYSTDLRQNIIFAQACIDYMESFDLDLPILFKQHPADHNNLQDKLKISEKNILLCNDLNISTIELITSEQCKLVVSVNSNTLHEALIYNIPAVALGTLIWNEEYTQHRPMPTDLCNMDDIISLDNTNEKRLSYIHYLISNQWFLHDFQNPLIVKELLDSMGRVSPGELRKKYGIPLVD